ncbi:hypothetical protein EYF80_049500 [Liparis tanakae]|uniref:Uncharacterized protein n=1 Tax=Liparis tanakae TaxID=230148 RepID=A0A4Z2FGN1_9TELE|nr:hypothetical protein EYF80_049500 [Liparis tanakae]
MRCHSRWETVICADSERSSSWWTSGPSPWCHEGSAAPRVAYRQTPAACNNKPHEPFPGAVVDETMRSAQKRNSNK